MSTSEYDHLILVGNSSTTSQVEDGLPKRLRAKLVDAVPASTATPLAEIVEATLAYFVEAEEQESRATVERLLQELRTGGLAVAGTGPSFSALCRGQVDVLVLAKEYDPEQNWACGACGNLDVDAGNSDVCPDCGAPAMREVDTKEHMVRMAEERDGTVEVVRQSDELSHLGGVGCLLNYRLPDEYP